MQKTFQNWLENQEGKTPNTAYAYANAINRISKHYQENEGKNINLYKITSEKELGFFVELYGKNGKYANIGDYGNGTNRSAVVAYHKFISNPENFQPKEENPYRIENSFDSEQNLQTSLVYQIDTLFPEYTFEGEKYKIGGKEIDVLLRKGNELLVIELKKGEAKFEAFGQISMYIGLLKEKFPNNDIKGCIIANSIDDSLAYACKTNGNISLKTYLIKIELVDF